MKLIYKDIDKNNSGSISLIAEGQEDMWHAYNLIAVDDYLRASTIRRVTTESATGSTTTNRVHTILNVCVKSIHFDTHAGILSVNGKNIEENAYVKMGAYHTIDLEVNRKFTITKREWDSVALDRIQESCDPGQNADLAAVIMQEGLAHVCLVLSSMTIVKSKIETNIPRKRKGACDNHEKGLDRFYNRIVQSIINHINFDVVKAVIIASPGFVKDQFYQYLFEYASKNNVRLLLDNKSKFLLAHSSSGFKHSLNDILHDSTIMNRLNDTKALGEVKALDSFYAMLKSEPSRAFYGLKHVEMAGEADAIDCLLITDTLFRSQNIKDRKRYVKIVDSVKANNGQVKIFSGLHVSGERIAAILRFPMPDIENESLSEDEDNATMHASVPLKTDFDLMNEDFDNATNEYDDQDSVNTKLSDNSNTTTTATDNKQTPKSKSNKKAQLKNVPVDSPSNSRKKQPITKNNYSNYDYSGYDDFDDFY